MERFFNTFKEELTEALACLHNIEELYERIANWFYYYNHERIHTILLMSPAEYAKQLQPTSQAQASLGMDKVSRKMGAWHYADMEAAGLSKYLPKRFQGRIKRLEMINAQLWSRTKRLAILENEIETKNSYRNYKRSFR